MATDTDADTDNDTDIFLNELTLTGSSLSPPATTSQQVRSSQAHDLLRAGISREDEGDRTSRILSERQSHYLAHSDFDWSKHQDLLGCALHLPTQLPPRNVEHGAPDPGVPSSSGPLFGARLTLPTIPETLVSDLSAFFAVGPPSWLPAESATTAYTQYTRMTSDTSKASDNGDPVLTENESLMTQPSLSTADLHRQQQHTSPSPMPSPSESDTSISTGENDLLIRIRRKKLILGRLMNGFSISLSSCHSHLSPSGTTVCGTSSDGVPTNAGITSLWASEASQISGKGSIPKRKRADDDEDDGEDEDYDPNDGQGKTPQKEESSSRSRRLACPYFKKDPMRFQTQQSCCGPGWKTVHRLKEHLNRKHALPISCRRCYTAFDTEEEHDTHVRSSEQCEVRQQPSPVEGFNARQKDELKSRPRGLKHMSEPQKWRHVYLILFPETVESNIPSPYYEFQTLNDPGHPRDLLTEYEEYLQRELPPRVLEQLKIRIEQELEPVEEELRKQIVGIARDMQLELFRSFLSSIRHGDGGSRYGAERTEITGRVREQEPNKSTQNPPVINVALQSPEIRQSLEDELAAWCPEPYLDLGFDGFDGQLYDFGQVQFDTGNTDSTYGIISNTDTLDQNPADKKKDTGSIFRDSVLFSDIDSLL